MNPYIGYYPPYQMVALKRGSISLFAVSLFYFRILQMHDQLIEWIIDYTARGWFF